MEPPIQLGSLYVFLQSGFSYEVSLITAVAQPISNFLLNKNGHSAKKFGVEIPLKP